LINLSFVPHQHRLLVLQSVGLCECATVASLTAVWNVYLSWLNNFNNRQLVAAQALLEEKPSQSLKERVKALELKETILIAEGSAQKAGERMSWA